MEYRQTTPEDNGFDNADEEREAMHDYIQVMMSKSGPDDLLDAALILTNICEHRALAYAHNPRMHSWYTLCGYLMRNNLRILSSLPGFKPQVKLEDPLLYYPTPTTFH